MSQKVPLNIIIIKKNFFITVSHPSGYKYPNVCIFIALELYEDGEKNMILISNLYTSLLPKNYHISIIFLVGRVLLGSPVVFKFRKDVHSMCCLMFCLH